MAINISEEGGKPSSRTGNEHFKAGDYLHAAANHAFDLSTLDELGKMHTCCSLSGMSWNHG